MTTALNPGYFGDEEPVLFKDMANAVIDIDKKEGIVEAFAAAIGNKDSVNDIVAPGAFDASLSRRKPRVVWGHNWNEPIGKVLEIREVPPTDPRLPEKMKRNGVGGLYVKVQFNLESTRGREAFASVGFFGEDQEWSIGYKTIRADYDPGRQANVLKEVELYEVSPVLHGANQLTGTISVKDAQQGESNMVWELEEEEKSMHGDHGDEEDYRKGGTGSTLHRAVSGVFGPTARIVEIRNDKITFARGQDHDDLYQTTYRVEGPRVMFTKPIRGRMKPVFVAVGPEPAPMMDRKPYMKEDDVETETVEEEPVTEEKGDDPVYTTFTGSNSGEGITINITGNTSNDLNWDFNSSTGTSYTWTQNPDEKAGRVLRRGNMDMLRQAMELIERVMSTGMRETEQKSLGQAWSENEEPETMVVGSPETVIGVSLDIPVDGPERTEAILDALEAHIDELDLAVVAPHSFSDDEKSQVSVYLSSTDNLSGQIEALSEAIGDSEVSVSKKDFFGTPKAFNEVFPEMKVLR